MQQVGHDEYLCSNLRGSAIAYIYFTYRVVTYQGRKQRRQGSKMKMASTQAWFEKHGQRPIIGTTRRAKDG